MHQRLTQLPDLSEAQRTFSLANHYDYFNYPFDSFKTNAAIQVTYSLWNNGVLLAKNIINPTIIIGVGSSTRSEEDWDLSIDIEDSTWTKKNEDQVGKTVLNFEQFRDIHIIHEGPYSFLKMDISRPILFRLAFPFLIIILALLIAFLSFVRELDSFLEGSVAILFGIFGIRQILMPPNAQGARTLIDIAIIGLYIMFGVAFLSFAFPILLENFRRKKNVKYVATRGSKIFHNPNCITLSATPSVDLIEFSDKNGAIESGRKYCKLCLRSADT